MILYSCEGREVDRLSWGLLPFWAKAKAMQGSSSGSRGKTFLRPLGEQLHSNLPALSDIPGLHWTSMWWAHQDSNLEPKDYESSALTVEL